MNKKKVGLILTAFLLASAVMPAGAWVRFGWRAGGWGWGVAWPGLYAASWAYPYDYPYYADAPYYPADAYDPYSPYNDYPAYANAGTDSSTMDAQQGEAVSSGAAGYTNLQAVEKAIVHGREYVHFRYSDGDISGAQQDAGLHQLNQIQEQARSQASANGGQLTEDQGYALLQQVKAIDPTLPMPSAYRSAVSRPVRMQPAPVDTSLHSPAAVNDLLLELRTSLDQKLKDGEITRAQHDAEMNYLDRIDKQAQSDATANGGMLTGSQEDQLMQLLHQAYHVINHNFVTR